MPCYERERKKFEIWKEETQRQQQEQGSDVVFRKNKEDEAAEFFVRLKRKRDDHIKALEDLRRKLREATSEEEKARLEKEIADLEGEIEGYNDAMENLVEFMRELERRTITTPHEKK